LSFVSGAVCYLSCTTSPGSAAVVSYQCDCQSLGQRSLGLFLHCQPSGQLVLFLFLHCRLQVRCFSSSFFTAGFRSAGSLPLASLQASGQLLLFLFIHRQISGQLFFSASEQERHIRTVKTGQQDRIARRGQTGQNSWDGTAVTE
jgi:hypothetical protein